MKRLFIVLVALCLILQMVPTFSSEADLTEEEAQVWTEMYVSVWRIPVYVSPSSSAEALTELTFSGKVLVSSWNEELGWKKVRVGEEEGYIPLQIEVQWWGGIQQCKSVMDEHEFLDTYLELLARAVMAEAGIVGLLEMGRVGETVINRLVTTTYFEFDDHNTMVAVLSAKGQYPETWEKINPHGFDAVDADHEAFANFVDAEQESVRYQCSNKAYAVAETLLLGRCDWSRYFSGEEYRNLSLEEQNFLKEYVRFHPSDTFWQTGFNPVEKGWNVELVAKYLCWENREGYQYYHYYAKVK